MQYCHYFSSNERQKHITDVKPCTNCSVPVCSSCITANNLCSECESIGIDPNALRFRAVTMQDFYATMRSKGLA